MSPEVAPQEKPEETPHPWNSEEAMERRISKSTHPEYLEEMVTSLRKKIAEDDCSQEDKDRLEKRVKLMEKKIAELRE